MGDTNTAADWWMHPLLLCRGYGWSWRDVMDEPLPPEPAMLGGAFLTAYEKAQAERARIEQRKAGA